MARRSFKAWLSGQRARKDSIGNLARTVLDDTRVSMGSASVYTIGVRLQQYKLFTARREAALKSAQKEWEASW